MLSPVDEIKSRLDIVDIVQEYVTLKVAGVNMKGLCPFHREKSPSFTVHKGKQMWHCFGCQQGGDMFTFIEKIENVEFAEALEILAKKANIELRKEDPRLRSERQRMKELLFAAAQWFAEVLRGPKGIESLKYLKEKRQLQDATIDEWQLGFAPSAWEDLSRVLRAKGYRDQEMVAAGMVMSGRENRGVYDRFRDRIMFPILDAQGTVVGFTGRQLHEDKEAGGKYVNTPETLMYHKGSLLFGFDKAKQIIREQGYALLVEGQMDVISLWQYGFRHAVAVSGTALTTEQLHLLKRVTDTLVLCFDADPGGSSASSRGLDLAWQEGFTVKIATLQPGVAKDPDEFVRKDAIEFARALKESKPILEYLFSRARSSHPGQSIEEKKAVAAAVLPALLKLANPIEQDHYLKRLAEELSVAESALRSALRSAAPRTRPSHTRASVPVSTRAMEEQLFALITVYPEHFAHIIEILTGEELSGVWRRLYDGCASWYSEAGIYTTEELSRALAARVPEALRLLPSLTALGDMHYRGMPHDELREEARALARIIKRQYLKSLLDAVTRALTDAERLPVRASAETQDTLSRLTDEFDALTGALRALDNL